MNVLLYIPTSLNSPEFEILISKAQNLINEDKDVTILSCPGGNNYSCSINLYSNPIICNSCNYKKNRAFDKIEGTYNLEYTNIEQHKKFSKHLNLNQLRKIKYDDIDIGLASYSSYLDNTKDYNLEGKISNKIILKNLNTTFNLYVFFKKFLKKNKINLAYIYNGRQNQYRPLARILKKIKIKTIFLEFKGPNYKNVYEFLNHLPVDYQYHAKMMEKNYKKIKLSINKKKLIVNNFYKSIKAGKKIQFENAWSKTQIKNKLPKNFNKKNENIVFFISSEFEYVGLGGIYDKKIYKDQINALDKICKDLLKFKRKIVLWVRLHPNLNDVRWTYIKKFYNLENKYKFLKIIGSSSKISSYSLLSHSSKVITFGSRMGIEAVYAKKPSIILFRNSYEKLKSNYIPKNHQEVMKLILSNLKPKSTLGAVKYALFASIGGKELKGFKKVYLNPGEQKTVSFEITERDLSYWSLDTHNWESNKGKFSILLGTSSRNKEKILSLEKE